MRIISEKCKIMGKKIYTKPSFSVINLDTKIIMQTISDQPEIEDPTPVKPPRNRSAATSNDELYINPFGE